ncbi:MAG: hypothetical protein M3512_15955, partial [Bacteroidota bacterium]|nr:hypothetical protein [Bacteroidota bacterium]
NIDVSFHKLTHTLHSRSKILTPEILQNKGLLYKWLLGLSEISKAHHLKEYKKGSKKMQEI